MLEIKSEHLTWVGLDHWIIRYSEEKGSDGLVCYIEVWVYIY